jgi:GNAT superfamily N-acetyltransferase
MIGELRRASAEDSDELAALFGASRDEALPYLPKLHTAEDDRGWMRDVVLATCQVWVVADETRILGFMALNDDHVDHLYVLPGWQGQGVGSRLLDVAKERAPGRLRLYAFQRNTRARGFYERRGFEAIQFGDGSENEEREPDVLYEWVP